MAKTNIANEIADFLENNATCKWVVSGLTLLKCEAISDDYHPVPAKLKRVTDNVKLMVFYGNERPENFGVGYRVRVYTTEIMVIADTETNLQKAYEELETCFYCWESNGGGAVATSGRTFHRILNMSIDQRGSSTASMLLTIVSKVEAKPT